MSDTVKYRAIYPPKFCVTVEIDRGVPSARHLAIVQTEVHRFGRPESIERLIGETWRPWIFPIPRRRSRVVDPGQIPDHLPARESWP